MELRDYPRIIRKRLLLVVTALLLCPTAAYAASTSTVPVYQATAKLLVIAKTDPDGGTSAALEGTLLSQQLVKSFGQMLKSRAVAEAALRLDPQPLTAQQLQQKVTAEPVADTLLIDLSVQDSNPVQAKRLTNSVARAFIDAVPRLQSGAALRVSLVEPALTPAAPIRPRTRVNVALGLLLGLMLGVGLALLREILDRSVKSSDELELAADSPVVGLIPPFRAGKQPIPVAEQPRTAAAEAFRKLRTNFAFLGVDRESLTCVISSPSASDGKSTVAANLGIALAQAGRRVALVDGDLREPALHKLFHLSHRVGTTTVLLDQADVHDAIQDLGHGFPDVLTCGELPPNPSELLGSRRMQELVYQLRSTYEVVLVDCAPLLPVTDPMVVSRFADGILLIARAGVTTSDQLRAAKAVCTKAGATVFGTVLNAASVAEANQPRYSAYYGGTDGKLRAVSTGGARIPDRDGEVLPVRNRAARHSRIRSQAR
jgi:polysaccharide biosynthesis transport protein